MMHPPHASSRDAHTDRQLSVCPSVCPYSEKRNHPSFINISPYNSNLYINGKVFTGRSQHISVLTICTFIFRQVCIIEPSFFKTTSGLHRRPFEGRHLVFMRNKVRTHHSCKCFYPVDVRKVSVPIFPHHIRHIM